MKLRLDATGSCKSRDSLVQVDYSRKIAMMTLVSAMWHLQSLDHERDDKTRRGQQIDALLAGDPKLAAAQGARESEENALATLKASLHDHELESKSIDAKIKQVEAQLSSGRINHPRELDSLEKDRQMHIRIRGDLDGKMLELMDAIDRAQKKSSSSTVALKQIESARATEIQKLEREQKSLSTRFAELDPLRDQARAALDAQALATYDRLRSAKGGSALARFKNGSCAVCGMQIPLGLASRIEEGDELVFCPDCGRILVS